MLATRIIILKGVFLNRDVSIQAFRRPFRNYLSEGSSPLLAIFLGDQAKGMNLKLFEREGFKGASYLT